MEQQHTLYTWSGCRGTPRCQFTHAGMYLLAHLVDVGQRPGLEQAAPPCLGSSFSFSRVPGPGAYLTVKKSTGFFCRTPTSSKLKVARDC